MNILIAPDSFKESLSSSDAAKAIMKGFQKAIPDASFRLLPLADGGEGTAEAIVNAKNGKMISSTAQDPLGKPITARLGLLDNNTAVLDVAEASGLSLVPPSLRDPKRTTSKGTGQLIKKALDLGAQRIIIGLGGSATNDGGIGLLSALGVRFLDANGKTVSTAEDMAQIRHVDEEDIDPRLDNVHIEVACDVNNPLTGPRGASFVYGPQKGGTAKVLEELDKNLELLADLVSCAHGADVSHSPGAGAAGGIGWALMAFLHASMRPGIELVADAVGLAGAVEWADLVVTGEGKIDKQTLHGKAVKGIADLANTRGKPVLAFGGMVTEDARHLFDSGIALMTSVPGPCLLNTALAEAPSYLEAAAERASRLLLLGRSLPA
ncbi:MAG: glycerate kinase [Desulfovibrio sp.]|nr:glycerate kinase [Desulfovibrio sp.]